MNLKNRRRRWIEDLAPEERLHRIAEILAEVVLIKMRKERAATHWRAAARSRPLRLRPRPVHCGVS